MIELLMKYHADINRRDIVFIIILSSLEELHSSLESAQVTMIVYKNYCIIKQYLGLTKRINMIYIWICLMIKLETNIVKQKMYYIYNN